MCPDVIFPILPPPSRPMTSHHVISHVTLMSHASLLFEKEKEKENKILIKSENKIEIVHVQSVP